jgi:hypothetical protein
VLAGLRRLVRSARGKSLWDKTTDEGKARRLDLSNTMKALYDASTEKGKANRLDRSNTMKALFDASTEEGKANKRKKSTEAKAREDPSNPSALAHIQHRLSAAETGNVSKKANAVAVAALLEAHVQAEHFGTMPAFLLTTWLSTMDGANPTKLQELKKKYCMLGWKANEKYTTLVTSLPPPNLESRANRHLHNDIKNKALCRTILTMRAQGHECGCDKAAQLGRILSYLYWKDKEQIKDAKYLDKKKKK